MSFSTVWAKTKSMASTFWGKVTSDIGDLWERDKAFVIAFGLIILAVKFRELLINLLVASGKALFQSAQKKNASLDKQEQQDQDNAEALIKKAQELPSSETPVDDNWYQK